MHLFLMALILLKMFRNHHLNRLSQIVLSQCVADFQNLCHRSCSITLPLSITATSSQIRRMTCISCVISTIVKFCCSLIFSSRSKISSVVCGSSALVASSQSKTVGSLANARAIPTRCFCPPDNSDG